MSISSVVTPNAIQYADGCRDGLGLDRASPMRLERLQALRHMGLDSLLLQRTPLSCHEPATPGPEVRLSASERFQFQHGDQLGRFLSLVTRLEWTRPGLCVAKLLTAQCITIWTLPHIVGGISGNIKYQDAKCER